MVIVPRLNPGRVGYRGAFRHPFLKNKIVTFGLGRVLPDAEEVCRDICDIFAAGIRDDHDRRLFGFHPRAVEIIFGKKAPASQLTAIGASPVGDEDVTALALRIAARLRLPDRAEIIAAMLTRFESKLTGELHEQIRALQSENKVLTGRAESAEYEMARTRRERNKHIQATVGDAVAVWKEFYLQGRKHSTYVAATAAVDSFVLSLPKGEKFRLADVESEHLNAWVLKLRRVPKKEGMNIRLLTCAALSALTKKSMLRRVGAAFNWIKRRYKLHSSPMDDAEPIAGASKHPEQIVALRRLEDIVALLEGLKPRPYWRALVATAIFTGLRYSELVWLKIDDVLWDEEYIHVASRLNRKKVEGTKTGRERRIPIERTTFRAILRAWMDLRLQAPGLSETALKSPWLFPTTIDEGSALSPRKLALSGIWSGNGVFLRAWKNVVDELHAVEVRGQKSEVREPAAFWRYGPSEWRHSFGTILGHCGWSSLEISTAMGNSEDVARRHYIVPGHGGRRWPFEY